MDREQHLREAENKAASDTVCERLEARCAPPQQLVCFVALSLFLPHIFVPAAGCVRPAAYVLAHYV